MKVIDDLWILTEEGTVLFSRVINAKIQDQLFGALLSALNIFSQRLADGGLKQFKLNKIQFILLKHKNLLFVANTSREGKSSKVDHELNKVASLFYKQYSSVLEHWDEDITVFSDFIKVLDASTH